MKVVYKKYRLLDGSEKKLLSRIGSGRVIRLFDKTPYPERDTDVVCCHFYNLACVYGCPYNCAWCYLKGTFRFIQRENGRIPIKFKKERDVTNAIDTLLNLDLPSMVLNTGELSDSLCAETGFPFYGKALSEFLMERFKGTQHQVLFLTKGTYVKNFLQNLWQKNAILSWSLNAFPVADRWELAPSVVGRIVSARKVAESGYEVRLRIDPMVAIKNFEYHYRRLVDDIFHELTPSRITLGCLRGLTSTIAMAKDKSWVKYLSERSNWGRKPPIETRFALYANIIEHLIDNYDYHNVAVCKDTLAIWKMLKKKYGLDYRYMKCNCTNNLPGQP